MLGEAVTVKGRQQGTHKQEPRDGELKITYSRGGYKKKQKDVKE